MAVHVPPFFAADPELWFALLERNFVSAGVTADSTKFHYVVGALEVRYAKDVRDIILNPPASESYVKLKSELIKRQEQKTRQLLENEEMGDRKPSQFLRHLRSLAGDTMSESMLRTLWIRRLPANMQLILDTLKNVPLNTAAESADAVAEASAASTPSPVDLVIAQLQNMNMSLRGEIALLRQDISELKSSVNRDPHFRESRARSRSSPRTGEHGKDGICWYHWRHGADAHKCTEPCKYNQGNSAPLNYNNTGTSLSV